MTGAHNEKVIERALDNIAAYCASIGTVIDRTAPAPATPEEIKTFFIESEILILLQFQKSLLKGENSNPNK